MYKNMVKFSCKTFSTQYFFVINSFLKNFFSYLMNFFDKYVVYDFGLINDSLPTSSIYPFKIKLWIENSNLRWRYKNVGLAISFLTHRKLIRFMETYYQIEWFSRISSHMHMGYVRTWRGPITTIHKQAHYMKFRPFSPTYF